MNRSLSLHENGAASMTSDRDEDVITLPEPRVTQYGSIRVTPLGNVSHDLPRRTDVIVVGGGFNGVMTAYFLAKSGVRVALFEKGEIAGESSGRAFGWISDLLVDPSKMELCAQSKTLWQEFQRDVCEVGYRRHGIAFLARRPDEQDFFATWLDEARAPGAQLLSKRELKSRLPGYGGEALGGVLSTTDGSAEPRLAAVAVARALRGLGVEVRTHCAVRGLDISAGRISGVVTEKGLVRADSVVFAGNVWSRLFFGRHGISVPQLYVITSMCRTGVIVDGPPGAGACGHEWGWRRQPDGGYSVASLVGQKAPVTRDGFRLFNRFLPAIKSEGEHLSISLNRDAIRDWRRPRKWDLNDTSPFERERILDPAVDLSVGEKAFKSLCEAFPVFKKAKIVEHWAGAITMTPDNQPIASPVDSLPGLYLTTGCSYGMTWAPALGRMVSDLIVGHAPRLDPRPYRLNRFFDGTKLRVAM